MGYVYLVLCQGWGSVSDAHRQLEPVAFTGSEALAISRRIQPRVHGLRSGIGGMAPSISMKQLQVPLMKYLNTGIKNLYGRLSVRRNFVWWPEPAQTMTHTNFNPCVQVPYFLLDICDRKTEVNPENSLSISSLWHTFQPTEHPSQSSKRLLPMLQAL